MPLQKKRLSVSSCQQSIVDTFFTDASTTRQDLQDVMPSLGLPLPDNASSPAWQVTRTYFKTFGATYDQGEPVSQLYHALKALHGGLLLFTKLPEHLHAMYQDIAGEPWTPAGAKRLIPNLKDFLQACLIHDLAQVAVNARLQQEGYAPDSKADDLNDKHDSLGGDFLSRNGLFSPTVTAYITHHGDAKLDNVDRLPNYHLSAVSQKTAAARRAQRTPASLSASARVQVSFRLMRFVEDYLGKVEDASVARHIYEAAQHDVFRDVFPHLKDQSHPQEGSDHDALVGFMQGALIRDLF